MGRPQPVELEVLYMLEDTAKELITKEGLVPYVISRDGHTESYIADPVGMYLTLEDGKVVQAVRKV